MTKVVCLDMQDAMNHGPVAAMILWYLRNETNKRMAENGDTWISLSIRSIIKEFPCFSKTNVGKIMNELENSGILISDSTKGTTKKYQLSQNGTPNGLSQNGTPNGLSQNGTPIPDVERTNILTYNINKCIGLRSNPIANQTDVCIPEVLDSGVSPRKASPSSTGVVRKSRVSTPEKENQQKATLEPLGMSLTPVSVKTLGTTGNSQERPVMGQGIDSCDRGIVPLTGKEKVIKMFDLWQENTNSLATNDLSFSRYKLGEILDIIVERGSQINQDFTEESLPNFWMQIINNRQFILSLKKLTTKDWKMILDNEAIWKIIEQ